MAMAQVDQKTHQIPIDSFKAGPRNPTLKLPSSMSGVEKTPKFP